MKKREALRNIPQIDQLLSDPEISYLSQTFGRQETVEALRKAIDQGRKDILESEDEEVNFSIKQIFERVNDLLEENRKMNLHGVVNGTGVILHTNLGRARLTKKACDNVSQLSQGYSTLEYDTKTGKRGSRHDHLEPLITKLTNTEAAMMVNNNAAATLLCLSAMAKGKEVVVSRGELVEIGGSFRIPDIMELGGAILKDIGTTNKTGILDYKRAITEDTSMLLKVHTSNYSIVGFTKEATLEELVNLGREENLPVVYDMGCGLLTNLREYGIDEPDIKTSLNTGIDIILFSGDKLLGGPQGGIIAGKKEYIDKMKAHPLARAMRVDKMAISTMEATLKEYLSMEKALKTIPVLKMITMEKEELEAKALSLVESIGSSLPEHCGYVIDVVPSKSKIGGGTTPLQEIDSYALTIEHEILTCLEIEEKLRNYRIPIITRVLQDKVYIDMRTILDEDMPILLEGIYYLVEEVYG